MEAKISLYSVGSSSSCSSSSSSSMAKESIKPLANDVKQNVVSKSFFNLYTHRGAPFKVTVRFANLDIDTKLLVSALSAKELSLHKTDLSGNEWEDCLLLLSIF
uniref:Uncharacterized protein n=1 Tax=Glossina pallidipes TaxID=7398 RepID=A0A1B0AAY3_GLOPL